MSETESPNLWAKWSRQIDERNRVAKLMSEIEPQNWWAKSSCAIDERNRVAKLMSEIELRNWWAKSSCEIDEGNRVAKLMIEIESRKWWVVDSNARVRSPLPIRQWTTMRVTAVRGRVEALRSSTEARGHENSNDGARARTRWWSECVWDSALVSWGWWVDFVKRKEVDKHCWVLVLPQWARERDYHTVYEYTRVLLNFT